MEEEAEEGEDEKGGEDEGEDETEEEEGKGGIGWRGKKGRLEWHCHTLYYFYYSLLSLFFIPLQTTY